MSTIAILGCGYVGLALGRELKDHGHTVLGMRRSDEGLAAVESAGLTPVRGDVSERADLAPVDSADVVVFSASAGGGDRVRSLYVGGLRTVIDAMVDQEQPPDRLVYTSSTGVFGDYGGDWVDEETELRPTTEKTRILAEAEETVRAANHHGITSVVARLGGLYGPGRYRIDRYLDGPVPEGYLNLVHRADAAGALRLLVEAAPSSVPGTVVVVDNEPIWKPTLSTWLAEQCGRSPPDTHVVDAESTSERRRRGQKRCSNNRLRRLGYEFRYPTYREGYRDAIEAYET